MADGQPVDEFELMRRRVRQAGQRSSQQQQQELKRQFARTGMLSSGAYAKQSQIAAQEQEQATQQALEGVDIQQAAVQRQEREAERGRTFAREERLGAQQFGAAQAGLQRAFQTSERLGGQQFAAQQAELQRGFATSERLGQQEFATREAAAGRAFAAEQAALGRDFTTSERQAAEVFTKNMEIARQQFGSEEAAAARAWQATESELNRKFSSEEAKLARSFEGKFRQAELEENMKSNFVNAINSFLQVGFSRDDTTRILQYLGIGGFTNFILPGGMSNKGLPSQGDILKGISQADFGFNFGSTQGAPGGGY